MNEHEGQNWRPPGTLPSLPDGTVHIWSVRLDIDPERARQLIEVLSPAERERAAAFHFAHLRRRYVVTHAALRQILAIYVAATPSRLRFRFGPNGKPSLIGAADAVTPSFNMSHSEELALIAVARGREVGVDVERLRVIEEADAIAERYFCPPERAALRSRPAASKMALFFTYWTRKEALLKATGDGLSVPLDQVDVSAVLGARPESVQVLDGSGVPRQLALVDLQPATGFTGALAVEGAGWQVACWQWSV